MSHDLSQNLALPEPIVSVWRAVIVHSRVGQNSPWVLAPSLMNYAILANYLSLLRPNFLLCKTGKSSTS